MNYARAGWLLGCSAGWLLACDLDGGHEAAQDDGGVSGVGAGGAGGACPSGPVVPPIGPLSGHPCEEAPDGCSADPDHDPWSYGCVRGVLEVVNFRSDLSCLCFKFPDGGVLTGCQDRFIPDGECFPTEEEPPVGASTGTACVREGATECAMDPSVDPWFYECRGGTLEVSNHEEFHGAIRCVEDASGQIHPRPSP